MKIIAVTPLAIGEIKLIRFARFQDARGFFTESFRKSDVAGYPGLECLKGAEFLQVNESLSHPGAIRGLHFQWNPFMGKMVRTIRGRMVDIVLDIRKGSPTQGQALLHAMPADLGSAAGEWIWVPPGFAHGNFFSEETQIEYFCTGEYSQGNEASISPLAGDIDWSLCLPELLKEFRALEQGAIITEKDRAGFTLAAWLADKRSDQFIYGKC